MEVIQLPVWRLGGRLSERSALRSGIARAPGHMRVITRLRPLDAVPSYCEFCARPIERGVVFSGTRVFCSDECSLWGAHPPA